MDFRRLEVGKRIVVEKSTNKEQIIAVGERGTIKNIMYGGVDIILEIAFDNGDELVLNSLEFDYQVY